MSKHHEWISGSYDDMMDELTKGNKMTQQDFVKEFTDRLTAMVSKKNIDYTNDSEDAFQCFKGAAEKAGITVTQAMQVLIGIKEERLRSLLNGRKPNYESLKNNIEDFINYVILLDIWEAHNASDK